MPQLMTGRYYHQEHPARVSRPTRSRGSFLHSRRPDRRAAPDPFARQGIRRSARAHTSGSRRTARIGHHFDRLEQVPVEASRGHADADRVVERGLALWGERDRRGRSSSTSTSMDMHVPRTMPEPPFRFDVRATTGRAASGDGRPPLRPRAETLGPRRRADFTETDRAQFAAVYDGCLAHTDARSDGPGRRPGR